MMSATMSLFHFPGAFCTDPFRSTLSFSLLPDTARFSFSLSLFRLIMLLPATDTDRPNPPNFDFVGPLGEIISPGWGAGEG